MRALIVFVILIVPILAQNRPYNNGNGRPGCRLSEEFGYKWRNNWDPIRYWVCHGESAVSYVCPVNYLFLENRQACVNWMYWVWTPPYDPPSLA